VAESPAPFPVGQEPEGLFPAYDYLATACVINLVRTHELLRPVLEREFRRFGLSGALFNVLMILRGAGEPLPPHAIGERLMVARSTVTDLLDALERRGFVRRVAHPRDRRMLLVEPTEQGLERLAALLPDQYRREQVLLDCLSAAEKQTLIELLGKIQRSLLSLAPPSRRGAPGAAAASDAGGTIEED